MQNNVTALYAVNFTAALNEYRSIVLGLNLLDAPSSTPVFYEVPIGDNNLGQRWINIEGVSRKFSFCSGEKNKTLL